MKDYFNFNRREKIGVVALGAVIMVLVVLMNVGYRTYLPDPFDVNPEDFEYFTLRNEKDTVVKGMATDKESWTVFDPNTAPLETWLSFGFSQKQSESILNYRENYGPFQSKEDVQKLYVISDEKFLEIEPFILIKEDPKPNKINEQRYYFKKEKPVIEKIALNLATQVDLEALPGIGVTYAERILKFRKRLGGFAHPDQINELYISDEAKAVLKENVTIDPLQVVKVNINTATKSQIKRLPYVNWEVTALILKEREKRALSDLDFIPVQLISVAQKEILLFYLNF